MPDRRERHISSPQELIEEARNGRMIILVDDEDRENEGDIILPAQLCTPAAVAFMAVHARGLICLTLTEQRARNLELDLMVEKNGTRHGTAFTTSIEARHGIDTGISAADRARTIATAIDAANGPDTIVTPGHVFPLIARDGGVLARAGHTEAAVDIARLAGLNPSGVICEVMNDDGTMARLDDLLAFGARHQLKLGTIRDLIAYRRRHDHLVERVAEHRFESRWGGTWRAVQFRNRLSDALTLAIVKGTIDPDAPTLVRMHSVDALRDLLGADIAQPDLLGSVMTRIADAGSGVIVLLGDLTAPDAPAGGRAEPLRDYGIGAQVLAELGVHDMILMSNSTHEPVALAGYGLRIREKRAT